MILLHKRITTLIHRLSSVKKMYHSKYEGFTNCVPEYLHTGAMKSIFSSAHSSVMVLFCDCEACSNQQDLVYHFNGMGGWWWAHRVCWWFFFPVHIFRRDLRLNVFPIFRCNLNACVSTTRRGPEGVRVVAPPEPGMLGSPPDRGRWS